MKTKQEIEDQLVVAKMMVEVYEQRHKRVKASLREGVGDPERLVSLIKEDVFIMGDAVRAGAERDILMWVLED